MSESSGHGHAHGSGHGHSHPHDAGGHGREGPEPLPSSNLQRPLARGEAQGMLLFLDTPSGIAGDMTIAALLDLGVPREVVDSAIAALSLPGVAISVSQVRVGALGATHVDVVIPQAQPQRTYAEIRGLLDTSKLAPAVRDGAARVFQRLALAEAEVHRMPLDDVAFHEVGAADAIVDIVGSVACLDYLGARLVVSPLPMGHGMVETQHGPLPLPAPATVLCLQNVPTYPAGLEAELVTPTGAALVATLASEFCRWPELAVARVGWGAGTRRYADRPNAVRAVLGRELEDSQTSEGSHLVVETNLDDMTGELTGHAVTQLLKAGALDAWVTPIQMKKGRPGVTIHALCQYGLAESIAEVLLRETSSIGARFYPVSRRALPRRTLEVETRFGTVPVKLSGAGSELHFKPEFDACRKLAEQQRVPVRVVLEAALVAAESASRHPPPG